jgi:hypothetical protein
MKALDKMMRSDKLYVHHIGGRGGTGGLPAPGSQFDEDIEAFLYDADPNCFDHMKNRAGGRTTVISSAVTGDDGRQTLYLNYDPHTSSMRQPNHVIFAAIWYFDII